MKQLSLDHNHAVDSHTFSLYPQQRQPTGPVLQQAQEMLTTASNPTLVTNFLHNQQRYVKPRDMYNLKYQLKFKGTPMEELQNVLDKPGITFDITKDANNVLQCVSFCSEQQKLLASKYGGVVLLDGTYRINKLRMPLCRLTEIRHYCTDAAWSCLQARIDSFNAEDAVCTECGRQSGVGRQATIKWLQCDACLKWLHLHCVGLSRQPRGHWFCRACETFTT